MINSEHWADRREAKRLNEEYAIDCMAEALLEGDYAISKPENVSEAIQNLDESDNAEIARLMGEGDLLEIGRLIRDHIETYWIKRAEEDAPRELAKRRQEMAEAMEAA